MAKVSIQAGHLVNKDPGAVGNGYKENDLAQKIVVAASKYLKANYENITVYDKDQTKEAAVKEANANKVDLFVEVHLNAATASASGFESFTYDTATAKKLKPIHDELFKAVKAAGITKDRGQKTEKNFYVLNTTKMLAILPEIGFISNKSDAQAIAKNVDAIGKALAIGIANVLKLKKKPAPAKKKFYVSVNGTQVGVYSSKPTVTVVEK